MPDLWHQFGEDLQLGVTGDLGLATDAALGQQRVLRRLLTSLGGYIWQPGYGASLGQFVGQPSNAAGIRGVIRGQLFREAAVARMPEPTVGVRADNDGIVYVTVRYTDVPSEQTQIFDFSLGGPV